MILFVDNYLQSASVNSSYSQFVNVTGGTAPYQFAVASGVLPPGLVLSADGRISGQPQTLGTYTFRVSVSDSTFPTAQTSSKVYTLMVLDLVTLNDATVDQGQFVVQFQNKLASSNTWSAGLTTQTSQTLIEYISAIGTLNTAKIVRAVEDAFPSTAQSDSAIRAIATMQGLRLSRMLPAAMQVTVTSLTTQVIPPFTQWSAGGYSWFNSQPLNLQPNVPYTVTLKEGKVNQVQFTGLGTDLQVFMLPEDGFRVSDQDLVVTMNNQDLYKTFGPLWNYPELKAFSDLTLNDGRVVIQFGSQGYGAVPKISDFLVATYAVTQGATINGLNLTGAKVTCNPLPALVGTVISNPSGGADIKPVVAYKNFAAGSFGTYSSGVTKAQYQSLVNNYPGVIDASTQAQREINPAMLKWMNVIRVSALTTSPWTQQQVKDFISYMQSVTMYTPQFVWEAPVPIDRDVEIDVYCFNSVNSLSEVQNAVERGITNLFAPRPGILMTDFYESDLDEAAKKAAPGQISYVIVRKPEQAMIVTAPLSPQIEYRIEGGGSLSPMLYSYAVAVDVPSPNPMYQGPISGALNSPFPTPSMVGQYWLATSAGTVGGQPVEIGDQVLATSLSTFVIVPEATNGVIDKGAPSNWVNPEVTTSGSRIRLDWTNDANPSAIAYHIWGRRGGYIGVLAKIQGNMTVYYDAGGPDPTPISPGAQSDTMIRYNRLRSLKVTAYYAKRQTNVQLPVRDSLN